MESRRADSVAHEQNDVSVVAPDRQTPFLDPVRSPSQHPARFSREWILDEDVSAVRRELD